MLRPRPAPIEPGPDPRRVGWPPPLEWWPAYVMVAAGALIALLVAARLVVEVLTPVAHLIVVLLLAITVAVALAPVVRRLDGRIARPLAVALVVVIAVSTVATAAAVLAAPVTSEAKRLTDQAQDVRAQIERGDPLAVGPFLIPPELQDRARGYVSEQGGTFAAHLADVAVSVAAGAIDVVLVVVLAIYLLLDAPRLRVSVLRALPLRHRPRARRVEAEVLRVFGGYLRGQLTVAGAVALAVTVLLLVTGMPYAFVLGAFAGFAELIPMLGPVIGAVPALAVALAQPFPTIVWVAIGFLAIQQAEAHVLLPRVSGHAVGLRPLGALLALLAGFDVAGVIGALFAVPVAGLAWVLISTTTSAWRGRRSREQRSEREPPPPRAVRRRGA